MGSLPDLTERARTAPSPRPAARTLSDPNRHRIHHQPPAILVQPSAVQVREWKWKRTRAAAPRRRDSAASSVGAASVRRLLKNVKGPARAPGTTLWRFALLCVAQALSSAALLPLTALVGAGGGGAAALTLMHTSASFTAPVSHALLRKVGSRIVVSATQTLLCLLLCAHALDMSELLLLPLYALAGAGLAPLSLAYACAATSTAHALSTDYNHQPNVPQYDKRSRVVLRRALRALRGARDAGLLAGALLLGVALTVWPGEPPGLRAAAPTNRTPRWPPPDDYLFEDDLEERMCGASGCPGDATAESLTPLGRQTLFSVWSVLALLAVGLGAAGAGGPPPPAELAAPAHPNFRDVKWTLEAPMALFIGLQEGFIFTSYMKWFAVCVGGWGAAWSALAGAGALQSLAAATLSMAAARGRRGALAAGGAAAHACLLLALVRWRAARTDQALPAVAAAAWGACGALWDTLQTGAVVGGGGWRAHWSLLLSARHAGAALACGARETLCVRTQLATLAAALAFAVAAHAANTIYTRRNTDAERPQPH